MSDKHAERDLQMNNDEQYRQAIRNFASAEKAEDDDQLAAVEQLEQTLD
ncbi:hypothetical protein [Paenibacillus sp. SI8]